MHNKNINKLKVMFELQEKLNTSTNGAKWKKGMTDKGKHIDWKRCIYMEAAEFIDSFSWKHWKDINQEANIANAKIELVDIWHFILSEMLRIDYAQYAENIYIHVVTVSYSQYSEDAEQEDILKMIEGLINETTKSNPHINTILSTFFNTCSMIGLSFDEIYTKYIAKNILNEFRQMNGYKEGSYIKIWNGREDNQVMLDILSSNQNVNSEEILNLLSEEYKKAV